ncbi:SDR family oxidoreductase [Kaistia dalseonensis]|uniref:NAD(P)-dependent dehydrogenase (Short-subunit alcohol dehydrogenase family) n=1 Tax=Kaistia dalseonensis TaxID=410840 RepID=A0ABU0H2R8_9HYPH|nr:SDR family oxidoreductase [Kaistia dalseonensis]MCX5493239.1 SDR family oxidoreductase [Kaistia dalseonensis]MDQ0435794.1 NAD(P)-dependent dehydrogenase (short-subunit alcohol dehydrogenase family) [Kaistia dalseonensis]
MADEKGVALVTGGAKRIGRAIVEDLARNGFAVAIHCNQSKADAEDLAAALRAEGGRATVVMADLADLEAARALPRLAAEALGPVALLVNNASIFEADGIGALDAERFQRQSNINLAAPVFLADAFAAGLPPDREGLIVNMVDQRAWKTTPHFLSYQLAKSGLLVATRTLAQALAPRIRVNAIGPGPTLPSPRQDVAEFRKQAEAVPLRRGPDLAEFGRTIRYLYETRSITGQMIALDGGQHLAWETPDVVGIKE